MHLHTDVVAAAFVVAVWLIAKNVLPVVAALGVKYHIPGANTLGQLAA